MFMFELLNRYFGSEYLVGVILSHACGVLCIRRGVANAAVLEIIRVCLWRILAPPITVSLPPSFT